MNYIITNTNTNYIIYDIVYYRYCTVFFFYYITLYFICFITNYIIYMYYITGGARIIERN